MDIVILGLSISSSWGNGHATTYRSLVKGLHKRGHNILFLERDVPWYARQRDLTSSPFCSIGFYASLEELKLRYRNEVAGAGLVIVGSYVPSGIDAGRWVIETAHGTKAFYDIDTPVTISGLRNGDYEYIDPSLVPEYDLYLSFSGGEILGQIEEEWGSPCARPLFCSVDPDQYYPRRDLPVIWDIGYLGTYSHDRQEPLNELLLEAARNSPAGRFVVAGPGYPENIVWPANVERIDHLSPDKHRDFYNRQRFTMNITRQDMVRYGYSPSVRLFEAAACGVPVISDSWEGLESFFIPRKEIFISGSWQETVNLLNTTDEEKRVLTGENARKKVLSSHTGEIRAAELELYVTEKKTNRDARLYDAGK